MQFPGMGKPSLGVVFDADMGASIDSALALALLYGFDGKNEARPISISVSKSNLKAAAFCEAMARFYAGPPNAFFSRVPPVGLSLDGKLPEDTPMVTATLARRNVDGSPAYIHSINKLNDTADVPALIRNALTAQQDQNCVMVMAGPATNLARVLALPGIEDWITRKSKFLVARAGAYPDGAADTNIKTDIAAAKKVFAEWPGPIVACGAEIGETLRYPAASIKKDFAWSPAHPLVDAYRAYRPMPYDAPAGDMSAVLYAVHPQDNYFKLSEPGKITVLDDGRTRFTPAAEGRHRYLVADPEQKERIIKLFTEIASAKPVVRQPRFRQQQEQKKDVAKPPAATPAASKP